MFPGPCDKNPCPVLILHGDADEVVPVAEAYELHEMPKQCQTAGDLNRHGPSLIESRGHAGRHAEALDWLTEHVTIKCTDEEKTLRWSFDCRYGFCS